MTRRILALAALFAASVVLRRFRRERYRSFATIEEALDWLTDGQWRTDLLEEEEEGLYVPMAATLPVAARN